jgi:hypothetical protein
MSNGVKVVGWLILVSRSWVSKRGFTVLAGHHLSRIGAGVP